MFVEGAIGQLDRYEIPTLTPCRHIYLCRAGGIMIYLFSGDII